MAHAQGARHESLHRTHCTDAGSTNPSFLQPLSTYLQSRQQLLPCFIPCFSSNQEVITLRLVVAGRWSAIGVPIRDEANQRGVCKLVIE